MGSQAHQTLWKKSRDNDGTRPKEVGKKPEIARDHSNSCVRSPRCLEVCLYPFFQDRTHTQARGATIALQLFCLLPSDNIAQEPVSKEFEISPAHNENRMENLWEDTKER